MMKDRSFLLVVGLCLAMSVVLSPFVYAQDEKDNVTKFYDSISHNDYGQVKKLLRDDPNLAKYSRESHLPPILEALSPDKIDILKLLVASGADVNGVDQEGDTPLNCVLQDLKRIYLDSSHGPQDVALINILLNSGASVSKANNNGVTPVMFAASATRPDLVRQLFAKGANINVADANGETLLFYIFKYCPYLLTPPMTPLAEKLKLDVNHKNNSGTLPIHLAAVTPFYSYKRIHSTKRDYSIATFHYEAVKFLVDHGADVNAVDSDKSTALMLATESHSEGADGLFDHEADVFPCVKAMFLVHADPNGGDAKGQTPLLYATRRGYLEVSQFLLDHGANVNKEDNDGHTPLDIAYITEDKKMQALLAKNGGKR